jgi:ATP-binding cassette subfamily G (WHITE) protein 2 (SNQ2)
MIMSQIILGLMLGSLFWRLGNAQADARTRFGLIFFVVQFNSSIASRMIPGFVDIRPMYYVQRMAGYYHGAAYYLGRVILVNLPLSAGEVLLFSLILYPMSGLHGDVFISGQYWFFWLVLYTVSLAAKGFANFVAAIARSTPVAMGISPIFWVIFTVFAGFMVSAEYISLSFRHDSFIDDATMS